MTSFRLACLSALALAVGACDSQESGSANTGNNALSGITKSAADVIEKVDQTTAEYQQGIADKLKEWSKIIDPNTSGEALKELAATMNVDNLKEAAQQLIDKIKAAGTANLVTPLKEKLAVIVDALKEKGADVTEYLAFLKK